VSAVRRWRSVFAGALAATLAGSAAAQVSGSLALLSDYRFRGVDFSAGDPAVQLDVNYDTQRGAYLGAFASNARFKGYPGLNRVVLAYTGYARRVGADLSVDAGLTYAEFAAGGDFDYWEAHAGVTLRALNVQVAYAPRYLGQGTGTYLEVNGGTEILPSLRLLGHAGVLRAHLTMDPGGSITQADGRVGLRYEYGAFSVQLSRVAVSRVTAIYPGGPSGDRGTWVVQAMRIF
jgi:uncharacterized protein (TIGR02001 family)